MNTTTTITTEMMKVTSNVDFSAEHDCYELKIRVTNASRDIVIGPQITKNRGSPIGFIVFSDADVTTYLASGTFSALSMNETKLAEVGKKIVVSLKELDKNHQLQVKQANLHREERQKQLKQRQQQRQQRRDEHEFGESRTPDDDHVRVCPGAPKKQYVRRESRNQQAVRRLFDEPQHDVDLVTQAMEQMEFLNEIPDQEDKGDKGDEGDEGEDEDKN